MNAVEDYEVYAIRYATLARKASENFIGGDPHEEGSPLDYFVWLIRSPSRTFVVDTGFETEVAKRRGRTMLLSPDLGLKRLGVDAAEVRDVIITHLHYDHVGNFAMFPQARFHLQDKEMQFATGRHMTQHIFSHAYEVEEVVSMVREVYKGRVVFHDGDTQLAQPAVTFHHCAYAVHDGKRPRIVHVGVKVRCVRGEHDPADAGVHAHRLQSHGVAADMM